MWRGNSWLPRFGPSFPMTWSLMLFVSIRRLGLHAAEGNRASSDRWRLPVPCSVANHPRTESFPAYLRAGFSVYRRPRRRAGDHLHAGSEIQMSLITRAYRRSQVRPSPNRKQSGSFSGLAKHTKSGTRARTSSAILSLRIIAWPMSSPILTLGNGLLCHRTRASS